MKRTAMLSTLAVVGGLIAAGPATAASPSQTNCEAQGGTFTRDGGTAQCVVVSEGKNTKFTSEESTSGQGNTGNKTREAQDCDPTGSDKCPGGQF